MTDEQRKGRGAVEMGPTAIAVAANVRRVRERRGWSTYQLAGHLARVGRPISASAVSKLERGERQVTVDDLAVLAVVLGVSPAALMLPLKDSPADSIAVTGAGDVPADTAWAWASNEGPLRIPEGTDARTVALEYQLYSLPPGRATKAIKIGGQWVARLGTAYPDDEPPEGRSDG